MGEYVRELRKVSCQRMIEYARELRRVSCQQMIEYARELRSSKEGNLSTND